MASNRSAKGRRPTNLDDLVRQSEHASAVLDKVRGVMLSPTEAKSPPTFSASMLCELCGIDREYLNYRLEQGDLPAGSTTRGNKRRQFSLSEVRAWVQAFREDTPRPAGAPGATISIGNFKGGVSKTTTTMALAQGLSLRGYSVLVIDMDPQGSLSTLFGVIPDTEVDTEATVLPLLMGKEQSLRYAIHESYWDGIDFVPANTALFNAEFHLPAQQMRDQRFKFWDVLNKGLDDVRMLYDVILIDTAPALSYGTVNSFMASDGLIVPLPPSSLDFASSVQFWSLFSELASRLNEKSESPKTFDFAQILLTRVDNNDEAATVVREWILKAYADKVMEVEIPKTAVASAASAEFGTVYDITKYAGDKRTYRRARVAYDRFAELVDEILMQRWADQAPVEEPARVAASAASV